MNEANVTFEILECTLDMLKMQYWLPVIFRHHCSKTRYHAVFTAYAQLETKNRIEEEDQGQIFSLNVFFIFLNDSLSTFYCG